MARVLDAIVSHRARRLSCVEAGGYCWIERASFPSVAGRLRRSGRGRAGRPPARTGEFVSHSRGRSGVVGGDVSDAVFRFHSQALPQAGCGQPMAGGKPFHRSYSCVKSVSQLRGVTTKAPRRGVHRRKRERRPLPGMMLFQDGSKHAWLERGPDLDLIVTMDDATSAITSIFLCEEEGTASSFRGLSETIRGHGLFSSFYTDRGSHYFTTPTAGGEGRQDATDPGGTGAEATAHRAHPLLQPAGARADRAPLGHACRSVCLRC